MAILFKESPDKIACHLHHYQKISTTIIILVLKCDELNFLSGNLEVQLE
jgi:hypothetical protein